MDIIEQFENKDIDYNIIKYNKTNGNISFLYSPDWDTANEPVIEYSYIYNNTTGQFKYVKGKNQIYHNKWQFVKSNYSGFNIEQAKERTKLWNSIPDIKQHKSKIGYKDYWIKLLKQNNIPV